MRKIIVGSRRSPLAKLQAYHVIDALKKEFPEHEFVHKGVSSDGDRDRIAKLNALGNTGVFTKDLEEELMQKEIDIAVHSLKDLPTALPEGLMFAATLEREMPNDALCGSSLSNLSMGARVGTGSLRRTAQLLAIRPDIKVTAIRGNLDHRLQKLKGEDALDAIILACSGLNRLGMSNEIHEVLNIEKFLPPAGQGAYGLEVRSGDSFVIEMLSYINHIKTFKCVSVERGLLHKLHGGCSVPIGTICKYIDEVTIQISASVTSADGTKNIFVQKEFDLLNHEEAIEEVYVELLSRGAQNILDEIKLANN